jgi:hypothetical protein
MTYVVVITYGRSPLAELKVIRARLAVLVAPRALREGICLLSRIHARRMGVGS